MNMNFDSEGYIVLLFLLMYTSVSLCILFCHKLYLAKKNKIANQLNEQLKSNDKVTRWNAVAKLSEQYSILKYENFITPWLTALDDDNRHIRYEAVRSFHKNIVDPKQRLPLSRARRCQIFNGLLKALHDEHETVRNEAILTLREIKEPDALEPLLTALKDESVKIRRLAVSAVKNISQEQNDGRAVLPLLKLLQDSGEQIPYYAILALEPLMSYIDTVKFGAYERNRDDERHILYDPDVSPLEFKMSSLKRVEVKTDSCDIKYVESFAHYMQKYFYIHSRRKHVNVLIEGNPGLLPAAFWKMCYDCKQVNISTRTIRFGANGTEQGNTPHIACNPNVQYMTVPMTNLEEVIVEPESCHPQQIKWFAWYAQKHLGEEHLRKRLSITINGNPFQLPPVFQRVCRTCRRLDVFIEHIIFGTNGETSQNSPTTLHNPDVSNLLLPLPRLRQVTIYTENYDFHQVERFLTYALNYLEPSHLSKELQVTIRGRKDDLHPNLLNNFLNLCQHVQFME